MSVDRCPDPGLGLPHFISLRMTMVGLTVALSLTGRSATADTSAPPTITDAWVAGCSKALQATVDQVGLFDSRFRGLQPRLLNQKGTLPTLGITIRRRADGSLPGVDPNLLAFDLSVHPAPNPARSKLTAEIIPPSFHQLQDGWVQGQVRGLLIARKQGAGLVINDLTCDMKRLTSTFKSALDECLRLAGSTERTDGE